MRKHHFAGVAALLTGLGVLVGVVVTSGHREASGDPAPNTTVYVKLINHCGHLILTEDGVPLEIGLTTVPPLSSTASLRNAGLTLPDVGDEGTRPVPAHPPYLKAYRDPASC